MNKKLFCLASLAALTLAGCGEKPEPTPDPDPDPDPQPTAPTVQDLKARFDALGESYKANLIIPATEEVEEAEVGIIINKYYTSVLDVAAIAGFNSGKYYAVLADAETEGSYEAQWGVYYNSQDEYVEEALLKNQEIDMTTFGYKESRGGFENKGAVAGAFNDYLGLSLLGEAFASTNLVVKIDNEAKVVFEFYKSALFKDLSYKVEVAATTETDAALEAWLENQEDPVAPFKAANLMATFYKAKNYTATVPYGTGIYEHEYVTKDSKTIARDVGWTGEDAQYAYTITYANFGTGKLLPAGVYAYQSTNIDVAKDLEDFKANKNGPQAVSGAPASYWVTPGYINPTTFYYYLAAYGVTYDEVIADYGQAFKFTPDSKWEDENTPIGMDQLAAFAENLSIVSLFEEPAEGKEEGYAGYFFESIDSLNLYPQFDEEGYLDAIVATLDGVAGFKNKKGEVLQEPTEFSSFVIFDDFGVTVDPYGAQFIGLFGADAEASADDVVVNVGETAAINLQADYLAGSVSLEFVNAEQTNATITETETGYVVEGLAATDEPLVVNIVINGAVIATFTVTVQAATPETFAGYWVCEGLAFELNADGTGTYSDGTNEYTVEFDPETGKITGGTFVTAACFDAEDSSFSWHGANLVCNFSQDSGDQVFSKEFTLSEKQEGFVGTWTAEGGFTIVLAADGTGTYNDGTSTYTIEFDAETGEITGGTITGVWDGDSLLTLQDGKLNVHLEDEYLENIVNKVFVRQ